MTLFAGAGIVPGSVALSEWAETGVKVRQRGRRGVHTIPSCVRDNSDTCSALGGLDALVLARVPALAIAIIILSPPHPR